MTIMGVAGPQPWSDSCDNAGAVRLFRGWGAWDSESREIFSPAEGPLAV
jgi:hypothetical protein